MTKLEEKRDSKRIEPVMQRQAQIFSRHGTVYYTHFADVVNLSEGGICIKSAREFAKGEQLQVFLPRREMVRSFKAEGEVIWRRPAGKYTFQFGVKFMSDRKKKHILQESLKDIMASYDARSTILPKLFEQ